MTQLSMEEWDLLNSAAGNGGLTLAQWDEVDRLVEDDLVTVTVRIPEQFYEYTYPRIEWDKAVEADRVVYLMDNDMSDLIVEEELYGPDGQQVPGW